MNNLEFTYPCHKNIIPGIPGIECMFMVWEAEEDDGSPGGIPTT